MTELRREGKGVMAKVMDDLSKVCTILTANNFAWFSDTTDMTFPFNMIIIIIALYTLLQWISTSI